MLFTSALRLIGTSKLASGLLAGLVAVTAGGAVAIAATHHTPTTTQQSVATATPGKQAQAQGHGAAVTAAVAKCKAALAAGQHGIGKCVSAVASQHGKAVSGAAQNGPKGTTQDPGETDPSPTP